MNFRRVLHVGCGRSPLPPGIEADVEVRLDIDPSCEPDIVASMDDLGDISGFDAVVSAHSLEHLPVYQVLKALQEFYRVLAPGGMVAIVVPDLEGIKADDSVVYVTKDGLSVTGLDMIYGMQSFVEQQPFMAHRCGFVSDTLHRAVRDAGFDNVIVERQSGFNLVANGVKPC